MGSGYRVFTAGEVLSASNVQNYLQDQAVMVFGGTAARSSAIGTANFEEGMLTYLTDVDKLQVYTGAAFADVYPAAASTQGLTLINTTSFSGVSTQSVNDVFSATYTNYRIVLTGTGSDNQTFRLRVSGTDNTTSNYQYQKLVVNSTTVSGARTTAGTSFEINGMSDGQALNVIELSNPGAALTTGFHFIGGYNLNATIFLYHIHGYHNVATAYDGFTILPGSGTITGSVSVYGYNK